MFMWFFLALAASVLWGLVYALHEQVYKHISVLSSIVIDGFVIFVLVGILAWKGGFLERDLAIVLSSEKVAWLLGAQILAALAATVLVAFSINYKNATVAGLVEMTYPLFIVLFTYLLFRESHLNMGTVIGGVLIFTGVVCVYFFNR